MTDKVEVFCIECAKPFWMDRELWDLMREQQPTGSAFVLSTDGLCRECFAGMRVDAVSALVPYKKVTK